MTNGMDHCSLCPRLCNADRSVKAGACGCSARLHAARASLHFGEEPCISGPSGSGTVFFSGCSLRCVFCQNAEISRNGSFGKELDVRELADVFRRLESQGAANLNLVTGTQWADLIREALLLARPSVPVLWNSSGYERPETVALLSDVVDVWLPDLKYADPVLAARFSGAADYPEVSFRAVGAMLDTAGDPVFDEHGMIKSGVLIRHLVLPLHLKNTFSVLDRIRDTFGTDRWVSLMFQYTPVREVPGSPELSRTLTRRERERAEAYFLDLGFRNGYIQDGESAGTGMIPAFDLTGLV